MTVGDHPSIVRRRLDMLAARIASADAAGSSVAPVEFSERWAIERPGAIDVGDIVQSLLTLDISLPVFQSQSRVGAISAWHRLLGKSIRRDSALLEGQLQALRTESIAAVRALADATDHRLDAMYDSFEHRLFSVESRIDAVESRIDQVESRNDEVESRIDQVELLEHESSRWIADRNFNPTFSNLAFGDRFRGSRESLLLRYHDVADSLLKGGGDVLDVGCGRGELVELIMSKGGTARGVEVDPELVEFCRSIFLDVTLATASEALNSEVDGSLGGVAFIQVVEHLTAQQLADVIPLAYRKLRAGGVLAIETVNGTSPFVFTRSFFCDPTHSTPVHHEYLEFLLQHVGFEDIDISWRSPVDEIDKVAAVTVDGRGGAAAALAVQLNQRIEQIDRHLFGAQDYLVIATK